MKITERNLRIRTSSFWQMMFYRWPPSLDWRVVSSGCGLRKPVCTVILLFLSTAWCCPRTMSVTFASSPSFHVSFCFSDLAAMISAKVSKVRWFLFANVSTFKNNGHQSDVLSTHLLIKLSPPILAIAARRSLLAVVDWLAFVVSVVALCNM